MRKLFLSIAVFVMALCANAQTNQYFWYQGNLMLGTQIAQIDSVTFGNSESVDTLHLLLPRTIIKTVHDTVYITIHDTVCPNNGVHNGFRYVDLGLSVMWADANVGAENPEQAGGFFAWGETSQKSNYGFYNYAHGEYLYTMWKYCTNESYGTIDNLTTLLPEDDAASMNMGGNWRTPTKAEWQELIDNCTITEDTINSQSGYRFIATNGNSIFIPRVGAIWGTGHSDDEGDIFYWSANVLVEHCEKAYVILNYQSYYDRTHILPHVNTWDRHVGGSVRGVFSK